MSKIEEDVKALKAVIKRTEPFCESEEDRRAIGCILRVLDDWEKKTKALEIIFDTYANKAECDKALAALNDSAVTIARGGMRSLKQINKELEKIPPEWRKRWCDAEACGCMGCVNRSGRGGYGCDVTKEEWDKWISTLTNKKP